MRPGSTSIVIAAFNAERWIARAIESVLRQTLPVAEVVVVDDGSCDKTAERAAAFGSRVRVVRQANAGPGAARNRGAKEASGEFLGFLDADDELLPEMHELLLPALKSDASIGAVSGAHYSDSRSGRVRTPAPGRVRTGPGGRLDDFFETARTHGVVCVGAALLRRSAFAELGGFREDVRFGEDLDLWARIAGRWDWAYVDEPVMTYHVQPESSACLRTSEAQKPADYLMDEDRMKRWIRPELWPSYRRYRRDLYLIQARRALDDGAVAQARRLLQNIEPAPVSAEWALTALMSRSLVASRIALRSVRIARRLLRRPYAY